jgi:molecular chaperone GrpE (heat shock protein)
VSEFNEGILESLLATLDNMRRTINQAQAMSENRKIVKVSEVYQLLRFDLVVLIRSLRALKKSGEKIGDELL